MKMLLYDEISDFSKYADIFGYNPKEVKKVRILIEKTFCDTCSQMILDDENCVKCKCGSEDDICLDCESEFFSEIIKRKCCLCGEILDEIPPNLCLHNYPVCKNCEEKARDLMGIIWRGTITEPEEGIPCCKDQIELFQPVDFRKALSRGSISVNQDFRVLNARLFSNLGN